MKKTNIVHIRINLKYEISHMYHLLGDLLPAENYEEALEAIIKLKILIEEQIATNYLNIPNAFIERPIK